MKHLLSAVIAVIALCALTGSIAFAEHKSDTFTFDANVIVNGTLLKAGTYDLVFDTKTNQLAVRKNGKTVATAVGHLEQRQEKVDRTEVQTLAKGNTPVLTSVQFAGQRQAVVIANSASGD